MLGRKTSGSIVCPSCGSLVGVRDEKCYVCGRANPSLWGFAPALRQLGADLGFVQLVIGFSSIIYVLTLVASGPEALQSASPFSFLGPSGNVLIAFGASGAAPVFVLGSWWSVLSAMWLHGGLLHILFNMLWVRNIGPDTANLLGPARTIVVYVVSGACGFLLSSVAYMYFPPIPFLTGAQLTVGASGSVFGLLGALVHYGRQSGSSLIRGQAGQWALIMFVFGLLNPGGGVDNYAHLGGFLGGYGMSAVFNPMTRERGDHLLMAAASVVATILAIAASLYRNSEFIFG